MAALRTDHSADAALIERSRRGDRSAYGELWRRHAASGRVVARSYSPLDPDDLVAESFTRIYDAILSGGGPRRAFRPYLFTTIRNTAVGWRRARRESNLETLESFEDPATSEEASLVALDRSITAQAFRSLPTRWQEVLWYSEVEAMTPQQIAPLVGLSANSTAALAYRAREGLRQAWIQVHLTNATAEPECRWSIERLGSYTRGKLRARDTARLEEHLDQCARCTLAAAEAREVGSGLGLVLLPLAAGAIGATAYSAWLSHGGPAVYVANGTAGLPSVLGGGASGSAAGIGGTSAAGSIGAGSGNAAGSGSAAGTRSTGGGTGGAGGSGVVVGVGIGVGVGVVVAAAVAAIAILPTLAVAEQPAVRPAVVLEAAPDSGASGTSPDAPAPILPAPVRPVPADELAPGRDADEVAPGRDADEVAPGPVVPDPGAPGPVAPDPGAPAPNPEPNPGAGPTPGPGPKPGLPQPAPVPTPERDTVALPPVVSSVDSARGLVDPDLSGTAEPGASVLVVAGDGRSWQATAGASGAWTVPVRGLAAGTTNLAVTQTDVAGNRSSAIGVPVTLSSPSLVLRGGLFAAWKLTFGGAARAEVEVLVDGTRRATVQLNGGGSAVHHGLILIDSRQTVSVRYVAAGRTGPAATASLDR